MSDFRFTNGATVNQLWGDLSDAEMIAAFQYVSDASDFAKAKLAADASRGFVSCAYVVCCHHSGKLTIFRHKIEQVSA